MTTTVTDEIDELRARLAEAQETLAAIRAGHVDAVIVDGAGGPRVYSLTGAETVYRRLIETMGEAALHLTVDGTILYCNQRFCELVATPQDAALGQSLLRFVAPEAQETVRRLLDQCATQRSSARVECGGPDGRRAPVLLTGQELSHGGSVTLCLIATDLTEVETAARQIVDLQQAQAELSAREALLLHAMEAARAGTWRLTPATGEFAATREAMKIHGFAADQRLDAGTALAAVHPEDRARLDAAARHTLESGEALHSQHRVQWPDGSIRWVESHAVRRGEGEQTHLVGLVQDITARRQTEEALRESEERLRLAQEAGGVGTWEWNADLDLGTWSQHARQLYEAGGAGPVTHERWLAAVHPLDRERAAAAVAASLASGTTYRDEFRVLRPDGTELWLESRGHLVTGSGARVMRGTVRDVSVRRRQEAALRAADREKDEFLAMLAHELRNPLAPIVTSSALLARVLPDDPRVQTPLAMIRRQTTQLTRLVDDLLDISRIARGRIDLKLETLEIATILDQAAETVQPLVAEKGHELRVHRPQQKLYVHGDRARLVQTVANLLHNAAKFTDAGGVITLEVHDAAGNLDIEVRDTGVGISGALLPRIFDLFVQNERTLDRSQGGLGIGLSVVKRLAEMHGGTASAHSAGPGQGSSFTVRLPQCAAPASLASASSRRDSGPRRRILVVDDNVDAADSLALLLKLDGHDVEAVYSAQAALDAMETREPEFVLLDIGMPQMDGYELARRVRQRDAGARVRLVAVTGYGQAADQQRAIASGFDAHLVKPIDQDTLAALLAASTSVAASTADAS